MFIGREQQLEGLHRELDRDRPSLIVVYGRRRIGKSTLLAQAVRGRDVVFYQATQVLSSVNLGLLKREIEATLGMSDPVLDGIERWEALLSWVAERVAERDSRLVLVLDEFPYLCETVDGLPSIVQKVFDRVADRQIPFDVVLCGSQISFMEDLLGERNPLRGRQTYELDLGPLPYRDAARFFPDWEPVDRLRAFGVFGGVPYYLQLCDPSVSLRENVEGVVLRAGAPLSNEASNVLRAELTSPSRYATILQAVGTGCTTTGDILGRTKDIGDGRALTPYIKRLEALRLLRITRSLDASPKARNRRYYLADPFLAFWYRFGFPNSSALATGHAAEVWEHKIEPQFDQYMGEVFEWIAREYISLYADECLPSPAQEVGKIWSSDYDLDVAAALLDGSVAFGECKWWSSEVGANVLAQLRAESDETDYGASAQAAHFLLFSRSGFTDDLSREASETETVHLVGLTDLLA